MLRSYYFSAECGWKELGEEYRHATPHGPIVPIVEKLTPETGSWSIEYKNSL